MWLMLPLWVLALWANHHMVTAATPPDPVNQPSVTVHLGDGRTITGNVDAQTDDELLWLRTTAPRMALGTSVDWQSITLARYDDRELSLDQLRALASRVKSKLSDEFVRAWTAAEHKQASPESRDRPRVCWLAMEASLANWDADAFADGVELHVYPRSALGQLVSTDGMLHVRLLGRSVLGPYDRELFPELDRWGVRVARGDFENSGAIYRLPLQRMRPEFDLDIAVFGELLVRLDVPGEGSFSASAPLRLRTRSPLRDELQLYEGRRIFRYESD
jgi:hypothetical protein